MSEFSVEFSPRFYELAGKVLAGIATDEEKLELKELKKGAKQTVKEQIKSKPEFIIQQIDKRIAKLNDLKEYVLANGKLPEKETTDENGEPKRRGRRPKSEVTGE